MAPPSEAILWAAALTSLKMEAEGPFQRDIREVEELIQKKYRWSPTDKRVGPF
jgi:hypothetical protein